jgi:hypothetical protein
MSELLCSLKYWAQGVSPQGFKKGMLQKTARSPPQVAAEKAVNRDRCKHEDSAYPEAPVLVHSPPVRTCIWLSLSGFFPAFFLPLFLITESAFRGT